MAPTPSGTGASRRNPRHQRPHARPTAPPATSGDAARPPVVASSPVADAADFAVLGVPAPLVTVLRNEGITAPFPIQSATLPDALAGRDVLGRGRTGSGKTIAFAVPVVVALTASGTRTRPNRPRAVVLLPTRELASQVAETLRPLADAARLKVTTIFGGVTQNPQVRALKAGVDIVVACPGRLDDLMGQGHCQLGDVEVTVLDEADHMADLGFLPVVTRILDKTPSGGQRLLFSATLDNGVDKIVRRYLANPVTHSVDEVHAPVADMTHHVLAVTAADKPAVVRALAAGQGRSLLFTRTKHAAKKLARTLTASGIPAVDLHGNLSQPARERNLAAFAQGTSRVLVATDIAARGIHVDDITLVVHVDPPIEHKAYTHRSGRTARAGAAGDVVTVMTPDQVGDVRVLTRKAGIHATPVRVTPTDQRIVALTGPPAAHVEPPPAPAVVPQRPRAARPGFGGGGRPGAPGGRGRSGGGRGGGGGRGSGGSGRSGGSRSR